MYLRYSNEVSSTRAIYFYVLFFFQQFDVLIIIVVSLTTYMYFRPNLHYKKRLSCARTTGYDQGFSLSVNGQKVKKADKVKFLGVIIDENLTYYKKRLSCARTTGYDQGFSLSVNGQKVKKADKVKFLGVIIDENLTWDDQIKHL